MLKLKPLVGTAAQWKRIYKGLDFMVDDNRKWKYIPRPDICTGKPLILKLLEYIRVKWWLKFPPKEPKRTFEEF